MNSITTIVSLPVIKIKLKRGREVFQKEFPRAKCLHVRLIIDQTQVLVLHVTWGRIDIRAFRYLNFTFGVVNVLDS